MSQRWLGIGATVVVILGVGAWLERGMVLDRMEMMSRPALPATKTIAKNAVTHTLIATSTTATRLATSTKDLAYPRELNLAVPFISQAPRQNWAMPYQEACEEASMLMVKSALDGKTSVSVDDADAMILEMVSAETAQGLGPDISVAEAKTFFEKTYTGYKVTVIKTVSESSIKSWLMKGVPVIIPASGKELQNPNFRNGGPPYHMLVMKGYLADGRWIVNDPGTRKGADYLYGKQLLLNAVHDWNGGDVPRGSSVAFVIEAQ